MTIWIKFYFFGRTFWMWTLFALAPLLQSPPVRQPLRRMVQQCTLLAATVTSWRHPRLSPKSMHCGPHQRLILFLELDAWVKSLPLRPWRKAWLSWRRTAILWKSWRRWQMYPNLATQRQTWRLSWTSWAVRRSHVLPGHLNARMPEPQAASRSVPCERLEVGRFGQVLKCNWHATEFILYSVAFCILETANRFLAKASNGHRSMFWNSGVGVACTCISPVAFERTWEPPVSHVARENPRMFWPSECWKELDAASSEAVQGNNISHEIDEVSWNLWNPAAPNSIRVVSNCHASLRNPLPCHSPTAAAQPESPLWEFSACHFSQGKGGHPDALATVRSNEYKPWWRIFLHMEV